MVSLALERRRGSLRSGGPSAQAAGPRAARATAAPTSCGRGSLVVEERAHRRVVAPPRAAVEQLPVRRLAIALRRARRGRRPRGCSARTAYAAPSSSPRIAASTPGLDGAQRIPATSRIPSSVADRSMSVARPRSWGATDAAASRPSRTTCTKRASGNSRTQRLGLTHVLRAHLHDPGLALLGGPPSRREQPRHAPTGSRW